MPADETVSHHGARGRALVHRGIRRLRGTPARWLLIFATSLVAFLIRLLVPGPVGQSDNRDGPRVMCGRPLGMAPVVPRRDPRFFRFIYFRYTTSPACHHHLPYPTSEMGPLLIARVLTPVFGLQGQLNLISLGILMCAVASFGIATLVTGLRIRWWAQVLLAAVFWVIVADAAFFDVFASPFEEPAALSGLLLVAAGLAWLGRDRRATAFGLFVAGCGGFLAILSKEQYLILAVPICLALILASLNRKSAGQPWRRRLRDGQVGAAAAVAVVLAVLACAYAAWDATSDYGQRLHHIQAIDTIFVDIVNGHDNERADLRALGLPQSWAKYAGRYYWDTGSVRLDPHWHRYAAELTGANVAKFWLSHPGRFLGVAQTAAIQAQHFRDTSLGTYPPSAGHQPGAYESRVVVVMWLMNQLPTHLGMYGLLPLWLAMLAVALVALRRRRMQWHRDGAVVVLCLTACAIVAFIPPAFFEAISTTRHMVGSNLATVLSIPLSIGLAISMILEAAAARRRRPGTPAPNRPKVPEPAGRP
jgi:hypothetical protein